MERPAGELKHKLRKLKKLECKLRFGHIDLCGQSPVLVFDAYFDLYDSGKKKAKYGIGELCGMNREAFASVIEAYMAEVYFRAYGFREDAAFTALNGLGLPFDADETAIKQRFRALAKRHHPDTGGDAAEFIRIKAHFDELAR